MSIEISVHEEQRWRRSPITEAIVQRLRAMQEGDLLHLSELSQLCHRQIDVNVSYFRSACDIVRRDYEIVIKPTGNKPYKTVSRLKNEEISSFSTNEHIKKLKGSSKKLVKQVETVDISRLDRNGMNEYASAQAYAAMTEAITSKPMHKEIERRSTQWNPNELVDQDALMNALAGLWKPKG